jgi:tetratricopeptide (TPR) repeat protein
MSPFCRNLVLAAILMAFASLSLWAQGIPQAAMPEFRRAIQLFEGGRYEEAVKVLRPLAESFSEIFDIQELFAITLDITGKTAEANHHFQKAVTLNPSSARSRTNLGTSYVRIGKLDEALEEFRQALAIDPDNATANFNLGTILMRQKKFRESLAWLRKAYRLQPGVYENGYHLAFSHFALGDHSSAQEVLNSLQPVPKERPEYYLLLALNNNALGQSEEAQRSLREILPLLAANPAAHEEVTMLLFSEGLYREALPILEQAVGRFPGSETAWRNLAHAELRTGALEKAQQHAQKALEVKETPAGHILLGDILEAARNPVEAVRHYQLAVELEPSETNMIVLGYGFLSHWNWKEAQEIFSFALSRYEDSWRLRLGLGAAYLGQNEHERATQFFLEAIERVPEDPLGYQLLSQSFGESEQSYQEAVARFAAYHENHPENPWAAYYKTLADYRSSIRGIAPLDQEASVARLELSIKNKPDLIEAHYLMGEIYFGQREWQSAIEAYQKTINQDPDHMEAHYKLGLSLQRVGQTDRARAALKRFQELKAKKNEAMAARIAQTTRLIVK